MVPAEGLIDSAPDGFLVVNTSGEILLVNKALETLFGYPKEELVGQKVELLVPERLRALHESHRADYNTSPHVRPMGMGMNLLGRRKDGTWFPVEISLSPLREGGNGLLAASVRDVGDRLRLQEERNQLALQLETEQERDRIAMDLHDGIMQDIYAAALTMELAADDLKRSPDEAGVRIDHAIEQLHKVVVNIRSYIFDLRPRQFSGSLPAALQDLVSEFTQNTHITVEVDISEDMTVDQDVGIALYHIAHEGLSNVQKHSRASNVRLSLVRSGKEGRLSLVDNGRGFDTSKARPEQHRGLRNMAARARSVGATFEVASRPGAGVRLLVRFPQAEEPLS